MANTIYSNVTIQPKEAFDYIYKIVENMPDSEYGQETKTIVQTFYTEEDLAMPYNNGDTRYPITDSGVIHGWLYDNVGAKWLMLGLEDDLRIESANYAPDGFLKKIYKICTDRFKDVKLTCQWYNENEVQCGVIVIHNNIIASDERFIEENDDTEDDTDEKWYLISEAWGDMTESCQEAIETEDMEFPIESIQKI